MSTAASASAPGKAILYGEHAVVYIRLPDGPVAAALSDMRVQHAFAEASASSDEVVLDLADLTDEEGKPVQRCSSTNAASRACVGGARRWETPWKPKTIP